MLFCSIALGVLTAASVAIASPLAPAPNMIPCGHVKTAAGDSHDLNETTKNAHHVYFTINGTPYEPVLFHVADSCTCDFFSAAGEHGSETLLGEFIGPADPTFGPDKAESYLCWINV